MKNNMKKIVSLLLTLPMLAAMSVTAFAAEGDFTGETMTGDYDFNYTVVEKDVYTDVSGVKLDWSVPVVKYTETNTLTWNTTDLKWEQTKPTSTEGTEVTFTLTNRGSYAVKANVSFAPVVTDSASVNFGTTNGPTLATIVKADRSLQVTKTEGQSDEDYAAAKNTYLTNNCSATIKGTVSLAADKLTATSGKLGTYTVKILNTEHTVTLMYCKTEDDDDVTTETITVKDGAEVTFNGKNIIINGTTYTDYFDSVEWVYYIGNDDENAAYLVSGSKVTADMTIIAAH